MKRKKVKITGHRRPTIIEMKLAQRPAFTNITTGQIVIDERLRKYPHLRKFILKHELGHFYHDKNINDCLIRDMRDYPAMLLHPEYIEFSNKYSIDKITIKFYRNAFQMAYYNFMIAVFVAPLTIFIWGMMAIKRLFSRKKRFK